MNNVLEIWKDVAGYKGLYQVSNMGRIKSLPTVRKLAGHQNKARKEKILIQKDSRGYMRVALSCKNSVRHFGVHRLVADAFIANNYNCPQVNHINGIKYDNQVDNLEWVTSSENMKHAHTTGLLKNHTSRLTLNTVTGIFYETLKEAAEATSITYANAKYYLTKAKKNPTPLIYV